jgi:hypothetical protein
MSPFIEHWSLGFWWIMVVLLVGGGLVSIVQMALHYQVVGYVLLAFAAVWFVPYGVGRLAAKF